MKVVWIVPRQALKTGGDGVSSDLASLRYRALIPMQGLIARGHDASVVGLDRESADDVRTKIADDFRSAFERFDYLVTPTSPTVAFRLGERTANPLAMYLSDFCTVPMSLASRYWPRGPRKS